MATKKAGGSTQLGRDSQSKRLGVKLFDGQVAKPGNIIVRQRGLEIRPGKNVLAGKDYTLFSVTEGYVQFYQRKVKRFTGHVLPAKFVEVTTEQPKRIDTNQAAVLKAKVEAKKAVLKARKRGYQPATDRPLPHGIRKRRNAKNSVKN